MFELTSAEWRYRLALAWRPNQTMARWFRRVIEQAMREVGS